jgi:Mn2+/Fe2+ NRAMP family transporter
VGIDPIQALIVTSVLNGIIAVPLVFIVAKIAGSKKIMGEYASGWLSKTFVWLTFIAMGAAAVAMFATL